MKISPKAHWQLALGGMAVEVSLLTLWLVNETAWARISYLSLAWTLNVVLLASLALLHGFKHVYPLQPYRSSPSPRGLVYLRWVYRPAVWAVLFYAGQSALLVVTLLAIIANRWDTHIRKSIT